MANRQDLDKIADEAAERAVSKAMPKFQEMVNETFEHFGFDPNSPIQIQELMVNVKKLVENDAIQALANSRLTHKDFDALKDIIQDYYDRNDIKQSVIKKVAGWFSLAAIAGFLAYLGSLFMGGGGGLPPVQ